MKPLRRLVLALIACGAVAVALFVLNGTLLASGETPRAGVTSHPSARPLGPGDELTVVALNLAKAFVHRGGLEFDDEAAVRGRLDEAARLVRDARADLVFLSEVMWEAGPNRVNQVQELAERCGMHAWAFGENYNFGLPFLRVVGGNAILSRRPLTVLSNPPLSGRQPFYVTTNNRRVLWCRTQLAGHDVLLGAVHNDSFDLENNARQAREISDRVAARPAGTPALVAGDFNAEPGSASLQTLTASGLHGATDGPATYPARAPKRRIDFVLATTPLEHLETIVLDSTVSDHRPVVARFRLDQ